ncbi:hypothetical protein AVL61_11415 [Kocuria rosea subsp. polaris]|uniref:Uncharacterized protein n=1 Tax=Kocuria rosea subsp. polaris TaxID=136273 RepID=A0A0W8IPB9_KOCRO|nr:hypothetical protein [Kocuria polaris]KUG61921.1 hypothetical protein AVL61_11415 [Kocuria polaris]
MLAVRDKLLLGLWLLPVALGLVVGLRVGDDDGSVMLFVTGIVAALYVVVLVSTVHSARRRRAEPPAAAPGPGEPAGEPEPGAAGPPGEDGRALAVSRALQLVLIVSAAVYVVVAEGGWTFVVVAAQLITVITMAAYVHERGAAPVPVTWHGPAPVRADGGGAVTGPRRSAAGGLRTAARTWPSARSPRRRRDRRR